MNTRQKNYRSLNCLWTLLLLALGATTPAFAQQTDGIAWAYSPTSSTGNNFATSTSSHPLYGTYYFVAGIFENSITFGSTTLTSAGDEDIYIACFNTCTNTLVWATSIGGSGRDNTDLNKVAISADGGVLHITGSLDMDGSSIVVGGNGGTSQSLSTISGNNNDIFVAEYALATGNLYWAKTYGSAGTEQETGTAVFGNVNGFGLVLTGRFANTVAFGPNMSNAAFNVTAPGGGLDMFVMRMFSYGGSVRTYWVAPVGSSNDDCGMDVVSRATGVSGVIDIYVSGINSQGGGTATAYNGVSTSASPTSYVTTANTGSGHSALVGKLNSNGTWAWLNEMNVTGSSATTGVDAYLDFDYFDDNVYVGGNFDDAITIYGNGSSVSHIPAASGVNDIFVVSYNKTNGAFNWSPGVNQLTTSSASDERVFGVKHDFLFGSTSFKLAGTFTGSTYIAGTTLLSSAGGTDIFAADIDETTGNLIDAWQTGGSNNDYVGGIDNGDQSYNKIFIAGNFSTSTTIGASNLTGSASESYFASFSNRLIIGGTPTIASTLSVTNSSPYTNFQWYNIGYKITTPSAYTSSFLANNQGMYWIEAEDADCPSRIFRSNSIYVGDNCTPPGFATTYPADYTFTTNTTISSSEILDGIITIDPGVTLDITVVSPGVLMTPCSKIIVRPGATLNLSGMLSSCKQWKGIVVEVGGRFNMQGGQIRDAIVAVYAEDGITAAGFGGTPNYFQYNQVSVALKNCPTPSTLNNDCKFWYMVVAPPSCDISADQIAPYINVHHHIDIRNNAVRDVIDGNDIVNYVYTFDGIEDTKGIYIENSQNTVISNNEFWDYLGYGVYITGSSNITVENYNQFSGSGPGTGSAGTGSGIIKGIGVYTSSNVKIMDNNIFNDFATQAVEVKSAHNLSILNNNVFNNSKGIYIEKAMPYFVDRNNFNNCSYGVESYNDDYQPLFRQTPPPCVISENNFNDCDYGVIIAPNENPYNSTSIQNTIGGVDQYVLVSCNTFTNNAYCVTTTGPMINQYNGEDPANSFNSTTEWDWVCYNSNPYTYYVAATLPNTGLPGNPVLIDNQAVNSSNIGSYLQPLGTSTTYTNCSYDPIQSGSFPFVATSVEEEKAQSYSAYPNPATHYVTIEGVTGKTSYILTAINGQQVGAGSLDKTNTIVDVSGLADGMYFIQLTDATAQRTTIKLVKTIK